MKKNQWSFSRSRGHRPVVIKRQTGLLACCEGVAEPMWSPTEKDVQEKYTYLVVNEGGEGKEIEEVGEESPDIRVSIFAETFIVKTIYLRDLPRLMVSAKNRYTVAVA